MHTESIVEMDDDINDDIDFDQISMHDSNFLNCSDSSEDCNRYTMENKVIVQTGL